MALLDIEDLPAKTSDVLRRRARTAGEPVNEYVRRELTTLAGRRVPMDAVVEFLDRERPSYPPAEVDVDALALLDTYDLPTTAWSTFSRRAAAAAVPLSEYVRQELISSARRRTVEDGVSEIREVMEKNPDLDLDMEAVIASVRYARGL